MASIEAKIAATEIDALVERYTGTPYGGVSMVERIAEIIQEAMDKPKCTE